MSEIIIVRKKGVIVLPKHLREKLNVEEGDLLKVEVKGEEIILKKEDFWGKLLGCAEGSYTPEEAELELDKGEVE